MGPDDSLVAEATEKGSRMRGEQQGAKKKGLQESEDGETVGDEAKDLDCGSARELAVGAGVVWLHCQFLVRIWQPGGSGVTTHQEGGSAVYFGLVRINCACLVL